MKADLDLWSAVGEIMMMCACRVEEANGESTKPDRKHGEKIT